MQEMLSIGLTFIIICCLAYYIVYKETSDSIKKLEEDVKNLRKLRNKALRRKMND